MNWLLLGGKKMEAEWKPSDSEYDVRMVLEAHGLLPEGPLLDEALGLTSLYADLIRQLLGELPASVNRQKALLAIIEEGLMEDGIIPNKDEKKFDMPFIEEDLLREGIIPKSHEKKFDMPDKSRKPRKGGPDVTKK
jgi:hypothetical protein